MRGNSEMDRDGREGGRDIVKRKIRRYGCF